MSTDDSMRLSGAGVDRTFHESASQFLTLFEVTMRQAVLYEPDNKILIDPILKAATCLERIMKDQPNFGFQGHDQSVFVNGQRLRCDGPAFLRHQQFLTLLGQRKIQGVTFKRALSIDQWHGALYAIARYKRESPTPFEDALAKLREKGLSEAVELVTFGASAPVARVMRIQVERRVFAARAYAKAMVLLKQYIEHIGDAAHVGYYHLKLQRAVQDLVTVCIESGWKYFGLVNTKNYEEYLYNHSVNVAVLSLILGIRLGLKRARLAELGMAAILHDLGKAFLPKEVMERKTALSPEDREVMSRHPSLGVSALLRVRQYNEGLLKRIMVICEHHQALEEGASFHPYSRIIAISETFDALTSHRPYRPAFLPDDAIRTLISMAGKRLDRDLVSAFAQTVGLYPAGTLVELSSGEKAVVFVPHPDPKEWRAPVVRIVQDKEGKAAPRSQPVDLSERSGSGEYRRTIVRTLDPFGAGINVSGYLYEEGSAKPA